MILNKKLTPRSTLGTTIFLSSALLMLSACGTTQTTSKDINFDSQLSRTSNYGQEKQSVSALESAYKRNATDPVSATSYARALRENDYANRAALILAPFANDPESPAATKAEYAAIQLALGNNPGAEDYAQRAVQQDAENFQAFHYLGIALDAEGEHEKAERAFRKGLEHWEGDPTPIMNNLALNLTAQGFLDEASELLQKAKAIAPQRLEIERNLRIVRALQQSEGGFIPKPVKKPEEEQKEDIAQP